jgi:GNAT superfamily N-acetyltransferase
MPEVYIHNAVRLWGSYGTISSSTEDYVRFETPLVSRVVLLRPRRSVAGLLESGKRLSLEDSFGTTEEPAEDGVITRRMPVMNRPPAPVDVFTARGATVAEVGDEDELAEAERVIVDGFPQRAHQPWARGQALPPRLLGVPGWRAWLARRDGEPAAAGFTFDDGRSVGVYWLATLPEHRNAGLARAIMTKSLAAHPGRIATLVATEAGEPLYRSLGFVTVSTATWYFRSRAD